MGALTNFDLFEDFYNFVADTEHTIEDVIKHFGGCSLYIPSAKTTIRNTEIETYYRKNLGKRGLIKEIARKYDLSEAQVYAITKDVREPSLF
jgi:Mor family transcriptional regulator